MAKKKKLAPPPEMTLEDLWASIGPPSDSPTWWSNALQQFAYYLIRNPHDKQAATAYARVAYGGMVSNALQKSIKDQQELDELRKRVEDIFTFRDKEKVI